MEVLADEKEKLELSLCSEIAKKMKDKSLKEEDFDAVFKLFAQICNSEDTLLFELKGYSESFQFVFEDYSYGIIFEDGKCKVYRGELHWPEMTFRIRKEVVLEILTGKVYSAVAHMAGNVDYTGFKNGAIRFMGILETVLDEISNHM